MKPLLSDGFFVVSANANKGLAAHLAVSPSSGKPTICNQRTIEPIYGNITKICPVCTAKVKLNMHKTITPPGLDKKDGRYEFVVNTDASFHERHRGVAAYACWINSDDYTIKHSELIEGVNNSSLAELIAVGESLKILHNLIHEQEFLQKKRDSVGIRILFKTDSKFAINALSGLISRSRFQSTIDATRSLIDCYEVDFRWVKAHSGRDTEDKRVNDWCDTQAKKLTRKQLEALDVRTEEV